MKALTLTQPWASLVAAGAKRIETRSWNTPYRGDLIIHSAKSFPKWAREFSVEPEVVAIFGPGFHFPLQRGLCVVCLVGCFPTTVQGLRQLAFAMGSKPSPRELSFGDFSEGRYAWLLDSLRPLPGQQEPVAGSLGLWDWPLAGETDAS